MISALTSQMTLNIQGINLSDLHSEKFLYCFFNLDFISVLSDLESVHFHGISGHSFFRDNRTNNNILSYHLSIHLLNFANSISHDDQAIVIQNVIDIKGINLGGLNARNISRRENNLIIHLRQNQ